MTNKPEPLAVSRIDCPELPEKVRWRLARGEHTVSTFPTKGEAEKHLRSAQEVEPLK